MTMLRIIPCERRRNWKNRKAVSTPIPVVAFTSFPLVHFPFTMKATFWNAIVNMAPSLYRESVKWISWPNSMMVT